MPSKTSTPSKTSFPRHTRDLPVTQAMLRLVRSELKSGTRELRAEMNAGFKKIDARFKSNDARLKDIDARFDEIDARFNQIDARFNQVDARFNRVDARFDEMEAKFETVVQSVHHMASEVARLGLLIEEQNSRNAIVLEGLVGLGQRQDRVEGRMTSVEELVHTIARMNK